ncbi:MAG: hypothetical protein IAF02_25460 [Anaerolineae bacterium]|nr:hypothetical protein [Anaerolineae bacterium]
MNGYGGKRPFHFLFVWVWLLLTACGAESPTPTPFVPTQAALVPVERETLSTPVPIATDASLPTAVLLPPTAVLLPPTAVIPTFIPVHKTETPVPTVAGVPAIPAGTQFYNLRFAVSPETAPQNSFPVGTNSIYALWDYADMKPGDFVQRAWKHNGEDWLYKEDVWGEEGERGANGTVNDVVLYGEVIGGLNPGDYYLDLFINGVWQTGGGFTVLSRPTAGEPSFSNLHFTAYANGPAQTSFPAGIEQVFAVWNYSNMGVADVVKREWMLNGEVWQTREKSWDYFHYGPDGVVSDVSIYNFEGGGLASGNYMIAVYLNGVKLLEGAFTIGQ